MKKMALSDRMKMYEAAQSGKLMPLVPALARLDGRAFHTWTRGLERPFDSRFIAIMQAVTEFLVQETNALLGYTQSDEITLLWHQREFRSQLPFDGKVQKLVSNLASMTSVQFNKQVRDFVPEKKKIPAYFDCRVWSVPNKTEAINVFVWREQDAVRNSIQGLAQAHYSHKELFGKDQSAMHEMLHAKGVNWNDYAARIKRGTYVQQYHVERPFAPKELELLPPMHAARLYPNMSFHRREVRLLAMPPIQQVINRKEVIFDGEEPKTATDESPGDNPQGDPAAEQDRSERGCSEAGS